MKEVIVLMCNAPQIDRAAKTIHQIRNHGQYHGDIVLFFDEDLPRLEPNKLEFYKEKYNLILKQFPTINISKYVDTLSKGKNEWGYPAHCKLFTIHKFYLFDVYFKGWDKVFYIDAGMRIYNDLNRILELDCSGTLFAHSNSYPCNYFKWKLNHQFNLNNEPEIVKKLYENFDMNIIDNFQSGVLLYDTKIIEDNTVQTLIDLMNEYPISKGPDQGYMNLYFICMRNLWKPLPIMDKKGFLYDYHERFDYKCNDYVMLKYPTTDPNTY
jgi:lipopolysaccharide biosynthesis glycosyltransferase